MKYRYRAYCSDCGESNGKLSSLAELAEWQDAHNAKHERGKCSKCGHWRDHHTTTDRSMREYLKTDQALCCVENMGMGDFCGCKGDGHEDSH